MEQAWEIPTSAGKGMGPVVGIVAEYNPFHNGHAFQISQIRKQGDMPIVAVMSGNFTQRGEPAALEKHLRARAALSCGVDLVLELPFPYACARAQDFAGMGILALDRLGFITHVSFGCECGDLSDLNRVAALFEEEAFHGRVAGFLAQGMTYAKARQQAVALCTNEETASLLASPNNTLAVEYLRAIKQLGSRIHPVAVARKGAGHDTLSPRDGFASASFLRGMPQGIEGWEPYVPYPAMACYRQAQGLYRLSRGESALLWKLRQMDRGDFARLPDVSEGLENRLAQAAAQCTSVEDFLSQVKTKRYPLARLRRILLAAALDITREDLDFTLPYLKILGFTRRGESLLSLADKTGRVPLLSKGSQIEALSPKARAMHRKSALATDFFSLLAPVPCPRGEEYRQSLVKLP